MSNVALVLGTICKLWKIWWPAPVLALIIGALVSAAQKDKPWRRNRQGQ